jgi:hypothetical protein
VPCGIVAPLLEDVTVAEKVTDWSTVEEVGEELRPTVVPDEPTVSENGPEAELELKLASVDLKTAVMLCGPDVGNV